MTTPEKQAQARRTACRKDVLEYLAQRQSLSYAPATILKRLRESWQSDYTEDEVRDALTFLESAKEVCVERQDSHGSTKFYQATATGVLAYERSL